MSNNEGRWDRGIRILFGLALLAGVVVEPHTWWGLVGIVPLATGFAGFCPLYRIVGIDTCPARQ